MKRFSQTTQINNQPSISNTMMASKALNTTNTAFQSAKLIRNVTRRAISNIIYMKTNLRPFTLVNNKQIFVIPNLKLRDVKIASECMSNDLVKKFRKSVEYNGFEWLTAMLFASESFTSSDIFTTHENTQPHENIKIECSSEDKEKYLDDLKTRPTSMIETYIKNFRAQQTISKEKLTTLSRIILTGKSFKSIPELVELNKDLSHADAKADIYLSLSDNSWIGISVKQSDHATKSNLSVHKCFSKEEEKRCTETKTNFLNDNGFEKFNKDERSEVNKLFYTTNTYWELIKNLINEHNTEVKTKLTETLYCKRTPYPMFEYDGKQMKNMHCEIEPNKITFEEHEEFYMTKSGKRRNAAKLFYLLSTPTKKYRVEIRWKGNIFSSSPQFQTHAI